MHFSRRPLVALAALASLPALCGATSTPIPTIAWGTCSESWVGHASSVLGTRLQCGSMKVPLDHVAPDGREMDVGVIRIRAAEPTQREGAIFFNPGGPGMHPGKLLRWLPARHRSRPATSAVCARHGHASPRAR